MIEERIADRFRTAMADEPPLGFDPDDVVSEAARRYGRRRAVAGSALATGGVAVAVTAVLATSTTGYGGSTGPGRQPAWTCTPTPVPASEAPGDPGCAGGGPVTLTAPASEPTLPSTVPTTPTLPPGQNKENVPPPPSTQPTFPGSDAALARLRQVIPQVLAERVPNLTFTVPDGGDLTVHPTGRLIGGAYRATGTRHRYVQVSVSHDGDTLNLDDDPAAGGGWGAPQAESTLPDGSRLRVYGTSDSGTEALSVLHFRLDGVIVHVDTTAKPEPGRTGLAVSQEVLTAIATDPRLTF